jgi:hypothetical protein
MAMLIFSRPNWKYIVVQCAFSPCFTGGFQCSGRYDATCSMIKSTSVGRDAVGKGAGIGFSEPPGISLSLVYLFSSTLLSIVILLSLLF